MSKKDAYIQKAQAKLEEQTSKLQGLKAKVKGEVAGQKIQAYDQIEKLEKKLDSAKTRLAEIAESAEGKWEDLSERVDGLADEITASAKKFLGK